MKKAFCSLISVAAITICFIACSKEDVTPSYLTVDGVKNSLNNGYIYDKGTDASANYRTFVIEFRSESENPGSFFQMEIYSRSTEASLQPDTYTYSNESPEGGIVSWVYSGTNLEYDDTNNIIRGKLVNEDNHQQVSGQVIVTQETNNRLGFTFNIAFTDGNGLNRSVEGYFDKALTDKFIVNGTP
jgi:hypothetical protein